MSLLKNLMTEELPDDKLQELLLILTPEQLELLPAVDRRVNEIIQTEKFKKLYANVHDITACIKANASDKPENIKNNLTNIKRLLDTYGIEILFKRDEFDLTAIDWANRIDRVVVEGKQVLDIRKEVLDLIYNHVIKLNLFEGDKGDITKLCWAVACNQEAVVQSLLPNNYVDIIDFTLSLHNSEAFSIYPKTDWRHYYKAPTMFSIDLQDPNRPRFPLALAARFGRQGLLDLIYNKYKDELVGQKLVALKILCNQPEVKELLAGLEGEHRIQEFALAGHLELFKAFWEAKKLEPRQTKFFSRTHVLRNEPIAMAAHCGHGHIVRFLLNKGDDVNRYYYKGPEGRDETLLQHLVRLCPAEVLKIILEFNPTRITVNERIFELAANNRQFNTVGVLLDLNPMIPGQDNALSQVSYHRNLGALCSLLQKGKKLSQSQINTVLHSNVEEGDFIVCKELLVKANPNTKVRLLPPSRIVGRSYTDSNKLKQELKEDTSYREKNAYYQSALELATKKKENHPAIYHLLLIAKHIVPLKGFLQAYCEAPLMKHWGRSFLTQIGIKNHQLSTEQKFIARDLILDLNKLSKDFTEDFLKDPSNAQQILSNLERIISMSLARVDNARQQYARFIDREGELIKTLREYKNSVGNTLEQLNPLELRRPSLS